MPLFRCEKCHDVDSTYVAHYWGRKEKLCSKCTSGQWHGLFPKRSARGMLLDNQGFLHTDDQLSRLPKYIKIVTRIS